MNTFRTTYDDPARGGGAISRDRTRELLGQVMGLRRGHGRVLRARRLPRARPRRRSPGCSCSSARSDASSGSTSRRRGTRATGHRASVRAGAPARAGGRAGHRRLRRCGPRRALAGGRRHRAVRRRVRGVRLRHAAGSLVLGTHAVLGAARPDRVRDRRDPRVDPQRHIIYAVAGTRDLRRVHDLRLQPASAGGCRRRRRRSPRASSSTSSTSSCSCFNSSAAGATDGRLRPHPLPLARRGDRVAQLRPARPGRLCAATSSWSTSGR